MDARQPTDPSHPVNREFNPRSQTASIPGMIEQHPRATLMGTVPMTAGPSVPIMTLDTPSLQAVPAERWIAILYVTNNSAGSINPIVDCHFTNNGQKVESIRAMVPTAGPGERLGFAVRGPRVDMFVDKVTCLPMAPDCDIHSISHERAGPRGPALFVWARNNATVVFSHERMA